MRIHQSHEADGSWKSNLSGYISACPCGLITKGYHLNPTVHVSIKHNRKKKKDVHTSGNDRNGTNLRICKRPKKILTNSSFRDPTEDYQFVFSSRIMFGLELQLKMTKTVALPGSRSLRWGPWMVWLPLSNLKLMKLWQTPGHPESSIKIMNYFSELYFFAFTKNKREEHKVNNNNDEEKK